MKIQEQSGRKAIAIFALAVFLAFIGAHAAHSFHTHQAHAKNRAYATDGCLLCLNSALTVAGTSFAAPPLTVYLLVTVLLSIGISHPEPEMVVHFTRPPPASH